MAIIYGIKNCDTIKKTKKWLDANSINYEFYDFKKEGVTADKVKAWLSSVDYNLLINKAGTTWRKLPDDIKNSFNEELAVKLAIENPSIIKRPVLEINGDVKIGFKENEYKKTFLG